MLPCYLQRSIANGNGTAVMFKGNGNGLALSQQGLALRNKGTRDCERSVLGPYMQKKRGLGTSVHP